MSAAEAQSEPTMEEILASIRKIISEDDVKPQAQAEEASGFDDVLELGSDMMPAAANEEATHVDADFDFDSLGIEEEVFEEPVFDEPVSNTVYAEPEIQEFDNDEVIGIDFDSEVIPEPAPVFKAPEPISFDPQPAPPPIYREPQVSYAPRDVPPQIAESIGLIGETAANAASDAFSRLGSALPNKFASGISVEEVVAYLLKPMLKEWLDSNLPRIVEERVEAELARIARRGF